MRKHISVFKMALIESTQYTCEIFFELFTFTTLIFILSKLWNSIYSGSYVLNHYSSTQMIWYIITAETICFGVPVKLLSDAISSDIRNGNIASHLNKPYNYVLYSISRYLGNIFIKLCIFVCTAILLGLLLAGPIECFSVKNICFIIIAFVFAVSVSLTTISIISMSAFWMEDNKPLLWLYSKVLLVFGILFPIDIFPQWLYNIARITPIFPTIYGPSKLMINYSASFFLKVLFMQIIYLAAGIYLCVLVYANGVKKLNVNGG